MNLYDSDFVNAGSSPYTLDGAAVEWYSTNQNPGTRLWSEKHDLAVSSFPHNNLGKDFRFNLRVLMGTVLTGQAAGPSSSTSAFRALTKSNFYSYYFYKINTIKIVFPYSVAYALHHENRSTGQSAMAS